MAVKLGDFQCINNFGINLEFGIVLDELNSFVGVSYDQTSKLCSEAGAEVFQPNNIELLLSIPTISFALGLHKSGFDNIWLGISKLDGENEFTFDNGGTDEIELNNENNIKGIFPWKDGNPNEDRNEKICVKAGNGILKEFLFDDKRCTETNNIGICSRPCTNSPTKSPTISLTEDPSLSPTILDTTELTDFPTGTPSTSPSDAPTLSPNENNEQNIVILIEEENGTIKIISFVLFVFVGILILFTLIFVVFQTRKIKKATKQFSEVKDNLKQITMDDDL